MHVTSGLGWRNVKPINSIGIYLVVRNVVVSLYNMVVLRHQY